MRPDFLIGGVACRRIHFAGIFGTGMSALAQYCRFLGVEVSGSDRLIGKPATADLQAALETLGCEVVPQDGSGVTPETGFLCLSTAIEDDNPDLAAALAVGAQVVHRSEVLAAAIEGRRTIAVAGTSGKSTVTAMIFEFLRHGGKSPSLISGAPLLRLVAEGLIGNAVAGESDLLVVEADESDGSLIRYRPEISVILNVSKDHKPVPEVRELFRTLARRSKRVVANGEDPLLADLDADVRFTVEGMKLDAESVAVAIGDQTLTLPMPGRHNAENLAAALAVCRELDCPTDTLAEAVAGFRGVARRFEIDRTAGGVIVVDDFAHNPAKIRAAVEAARGLSKRIIAIYQPHGFAPTRFLMDEYALAFREIFRAGDALYLLPIYYAGGTAVKDVSSDLVIERTGEVPFQARAVTGRDETLALVAKRARPGDCVLLMGARDPSLPFFARDLAAIAGETGRRQ